MFCKPSVLTRALAQHSKYMPTASENLRELRQTWIPIRVSSRVNKRNVRYIAESILTGTPDLKGYQGLSEEHRIAVVLTLFQGYAEILADMLSKGATSETLYTKRVFEFLAYIPLSHATLAIRNCGPREGGVYTMKVIQGLNLTRIPEVMKVYMSIRQAWDERGYDWNRRYAEEAMTA